MNGRGAGPGLPDPHRAADRLAIVEVLGTFCIRVDEYDVDAACEVFTDDCVAELGPGGEGPVEGREAARERLARDQAAFRRTHHQLGQSVISFGSGHDRAQVITYMTVWREGHDDSRDTVLLRHVDSVLRTPAGWRISRRAVEVGGAVRFPGAVQESGDGWVWVQRRATGPGA